MSIRQQHPDPLVETLARVRDEDLRPLGRSPAALALLEEILSTPKGRTSPRPLRDKARPRRWKRRPAAIALVAATGLVVLASVAGGLGREVRVSAAEALADPAAVTRRLQEEGIDARILVVPADLPGTWWHLYFAPGVEVDDLDWAKLKAQVGVGVLGLPEEILDAGRGVSHAEVLVIPGDLPGPVTLVVGRAARPGEQLAAMDNELAPDGAFYCWHLEQESPEEAGRVLRELGYRVTFVARDSRVPDFEAYEDPPAGTAVVSAALSAPDEVRIDLSPTTSAETDRLDQGTPTRGAPTPDWAPTCSDAETS